MVNKLACILLLSTCISYGQNSFPSSGAAIIANDGGQLKLTGGAVDAGVWTYNGKLFLADWNTAANGLNINLSDGKVGIGSQSPGGKLDINAGSLYAIRTSTSSRYVIEVKNSSDTGGGWWLVNDPGGSFALHENSVGDQVTVKEGGFMGLGTTSPLERLHVNGSVRGNINGALRINSGYGYLDVGAQNSDWAHIQTDRPKFYFNKAIDVDGAISSYGSNSLILQTGGTTQLTVAASTGNVGIGTATPDSKLTVKGIIHTQEVKVDLNGSVAPDYVFEKDYPLTSLEELKSYIDLNKHLPEIPSAKEMEEEGINLKEMNLLLLKKVEELTLYVIEQKAEIKELQKIIKKK